MSHNKSPWLLVARGLFPSRWGSPPVCSPSRPSSPWAGCPAEAVWTLPALVGTGEGSAARSPVQVLPGLCAEIFSPGPVLQASCCDPSASRRPELEGTGVGAGWRSGCPGLRQS